MAAFGSCQAKTCRAGSHPRPVIQDERRQARKLPQTIVPGRNLPAKPPQCGLGLTGLLVELEPKRADLMERICDRPLMPASKLTA